MFYNIFLQGSFFKFYSYRKVMAGVCQMAAE